MTRRLVPGTALAAGTHVPYCKHSDDDLIIEPDDHPGWEVRLLHIDGVRVRPGARVRPAWPHLHIEIDDPNVPDRPTGPGC